MRRAIFQSIILGALLVIFAFPMSELRAAAATPVPQQGQQSTPPQQQGQQPPGGYQISVASQLVDVDVVVSDGNGNFLPNLKKENFRVLDDGKPQIITNFTPIGEAPITVVLLIEYRARLYTGPYYANMTKYWASAFLNNLKKNDWVALMDYDLKTRVDVDFTHDPMEILDYMRQLQVPMFSESCIYDALAETLDRLHDVKGKKAILVVGTGQDTFSKLTFDKTLPIIRESDVSIYSIGTTQVMINNAGGGLSGMGVLQAQSQLKTFSELSGGQSWTPQFEGEIPEIMQTVAASLRNQYSLGYAPPTQDGKYHKIKVEILAPDGGPLTVLDQKGKKIKFLVYARQGYTASKAAGAD